MDIILYYFIKNNFLKVVANKCLFIFLQDIKAISSLPLPGYIVQPVSPFLALFFTYVSCILCSIHMYTGS